MVRINIDTGNAAFDGPDFGPEVARILRRLADNIERDAGSAVCADGMSYALRDVNGNKVGNCEVTPEEGDEA